MAYDNTPSFLVSASQRVAARVSVSFNDSPGQSGHPTRAIRHAGCGRAANQVGETIGNGPLHRLAGDTFRLGDVERDARPVAQPSSYVNRSSVQ